MPEGCNDGQALLGALGAPGADISAILSSLRGPWAVVHWQARTETLWIGRDPIGKTSRRSTAPTSVVRDAAPFK